MATNTAVSSQTAAGSGDVSVDDGASIQVWTSPQLANGETVKISRTDGSSVVEPVDEGDGQVALTSKRRMVRLNGPATFRLSKSATATATAVYYDN